MNKLPVIACLTTIFIGGVCAAEPSSPQDQQLIDVLKQVQAQQTAIGENQTKIDAKLVTVAEAVRVARIYSSRGGH